MRPHPLLYLLFAGLLAACVPVAPDAPAVREVGDIETLRALLEADPVPPRIRLLPGTYRTRSPLRIEYVHGTRIEAHGAHLILESPDENVIEIRDSSGISLIGLHARHAAPSGPPGCLGTVVQIENSEGIEIAESELDGSGIVGIAAYDSPGLLIRDNHIHHNSAYPVVYQGPSVTLRGNRFEANGNGNRIAFSRDSETWPPAHDIGEDTELPGLHMRDNRFTAPGN